MRALSVSVGRRVVRAGSSTLAGDRIDFELLLVRAAELVVLIAESGVGGGGLAAGCWPAFQAGKIRVQPSTGVYVAGGTACVKIRCRRLLEPCEMGQATRKAATAISLSLLVR